MPMRSIFAALIIAIALIVNSGTVAHAQFIQQGNKLVGGGNIGSSEQGKGVSISADGNTMLVGGYNDNGATGAVWVFTRNNGAWRPQGGKLIGAGYVGAARQGVSVSVSDDGNTAIVGGYTDLGGVGAAWIYSRTDSTWTQQGPKLVGSGFAGNGWQGVSVAISGDGNTAMIGGQHDNNDTGAVWVFTRSANTWSQQGSKLVGTGATGAAQQGQSVYLSEDGNTGIVGATYDNGLTGAVWIYTRSGGVWTQQGSKLVGTGHVGGSAQGGSVALSSDGNTALVGGHFDNNNVGAAWIYTRNSGVWTQQGGKITGSGVSGLTWFGRWVSISADGNRAVMGGPYHDGSIGGFWVFERSAGAWSQQGEKYVGAGTVGAAFQGDGVGISGDGNTITVGGEYDNSHTGAAWIFQFDTSQVVGSQVVGRWSFEELSGQSVYDSSGKGNHGTAVGTAIVLGHIGYARNFNGIFEYVVVPNPPNGSLNFANDQSFTISAWFNTIADQGHLLRRGLTPAPGFLIGVSEGKIAAIVGNYDGVGPTDTLIVIKSDLAYNDGTWHKVTFVRDRERQKMYLYLDDLQAAAPVNDPFSLPLISDRPLTFGMWENPSFPGYYQGSLDEISISEGAKHPPGAHVPMIQVSPQSINFGPVLSGTSTSRTLVLRNLGIQDTLNVTGITSTNPLFQASVGYSNIPAGGEDAIHVLYGPTSVHADTATLILSSNDPLKPIVNVHLSGQGYEPAAEPIITSIRDIPNDDGHNVRVVWSRSVYDGLNDSLSATEYNLWRRVDGNQSTVTAAGVPDGKIFTSGDHLYLFADGELWDYIARIPPVNFDDYAYVAPTLADSTLQSGIQWSVFKVSVHMASGEFFFSSADSGYSVDVSAPSSPSNVTVSQHAGVMNLKWDAPTESDVDHYSVYAGTVSNFIPDLTALVGKSKDNSFNYLNSTGESTLYFRVRAVDKAGNQGQFSTEASNSITGLEEGKAIPTAFKLYQNYPNPFNPSATIKFDVAKEELIVLKVYNIIGQEVITLANRKMQPGSYETTWKASNAPTGLYMVRMTAGSYTSVMKMLLVK